MEAARKYGDRVIFLLAVLCSSTTPLRLPQFHWWRFFSFARWDITYYDGVRSCRDRGKSSKSELRCQSDGAEFAGLGFLGQIGCQLGRTFIGSHSPVSGGSSSSNDTSFPFILARLSF